MKKLLFLMMVVFIGGCASGDLLGPPSSDSEAVTNDFDQSTTLRSAPATFYYKNTDRLSKSFDITSAQWSSKVKGVVTLNLSVPGWENIEKMQFNADGTIYDLRKLDSSTNLTNNSISGDKLSEISFIMPLSSLRKIYNAQTVMVRVITLKRVHYVSDFHRKGVSFDGYVDAYTVLKKFLAKLDELNSK